MYPSLKTPVIGLELIPLNLTALYCPWRMGVSPESVPGTRRGSVENLERGRPFERRKVEKAGDAIHVEQVELFGVAREAHRDDRRVREQRVVLPLFQRNRRQHVVVADHYVGRHLPRGAHRRVETYGIGGRDAHLGEIASNVLTQKAMARYAQRAKRSRVIGALICLEIHLRVDRKP